MSTTLSDLNSNLDELYVEISDIIKSVGNIGFLDNTDIDTLSGNKISSINDKIKNIGLFFPKDSETRINSFVNDTLELYSDDKFNFNSDDEVFVTDKVTGRYTEGKFGMDYSVNYGENELDLWEAVGGGNTKDYHDTLSGSGLRHRLNSTFINSTKQDLEDVGYKIKTTFYIAFNVYNNSPSVNYSPSHYASYFEDSEWKIINGTISGSILNIGYWKIPERYITVVNDSYSVDSPINNNKYDCSINISYYSELRDSDSPIDSDYLNNPDELENLDWISVDSLSELNNKQMFTSGGNDINIWENINNDSSSSLGSWYNEDMLLLPYSSHFESFTDASIDTSVLVYAPGTSSVIYKVEVITPEFSSDGGYYNYNNDFINETTDSLSNEASIALRILKPTNYETFDTSTTTSSIVHFDMGFQVLHIDRTLIKDSVVEEVE